MFSRFITAAKAGGPVEVWGWADTRWPVVNSRDLATAYRLVLERGVAGRAYHVAAEAGVAAGDIARTVARDQVMISTRMRDELGWQPATTDVIAEVA